MYNQTMSLTQNIEYPTGAVLDKTVGYVWVGEDILHKTFHKTMEILHTKKCIINLQRKVNRLDLKYERFGFTMELNRLLLISYTSECGDPGSKQKPSARYAEASKNARYYEKAMRKLSSKMSDLEDMIFDAEEALDLMNQSPVI